MFSETRFRYIKVLSHTLLIITGQKNIVRYTELGLMFRSTEGGSSYRGFTVTAYKRITRGDMTYGRGFPGTKRCPVFSLHPRPTGFQCKLRLLLVS